VNLAALLLPFVVALPPGAAAPPPGALPAGAHVSTLDRELGLALVRLPARGVAPALRRLRAAPGVRYVERDASLELAAVGDGCSPVGREDEKPYPGWRAAIHLSQRSAAGMVIGIADSGVDDDRLAPRQAPLLSLAAGGAPRPQDPLGHGTAVASILVANRPDVKVVGLVPDATLLSARIVNQKSCNQKMLEDGLVTALGWLRRQGAQVVNVSATARRSRALVDSLRALQLSGALVVAAVGNGGSSARYPAWQPGVLGVGALAPGSAKKVDPDSTRGPQVDLVAPGEGIKVMASTRISGITPTVITPRGTSFAAPLVTGAAAMVWAPTLRRSGSACPVSTGATASSTSGALCTRRSCPIRTSRTTGPRPRCSSGLCTRGPSSLRASAMPATVSMPTRSTCPPAGAGGRCCGAPRAVWC
jgi:subtilisin family serine protease